jgi:hypothetical protein
MITFIPGGNLKNQYATNNNVNVVHMLYFRTVLISESLTLLLEFCIVSLGGVPCKTF